MKRLLKGMAIGSLIGAIISLFNRETRNELKETVDKTKIYIENPTLIKEKAISLKQNAEEIVEDITEVASLVEAVKTQAQSSYKKVKETKEG
ncbi:MAG TPA: hypothetical protein VLA13_00110 [Massilibacterium sp.]|nr:hypothetical protein [Massilibacterium sp.]